MSDNQQRIKCLSEEVKQIRLLSNSDVKSNSLNNSVKDSTKPLKVHNQHHKSNIETTKTTENVVDGTFGNSEKPIGWMYGLFGCMKPILSLIGKSGVIEIKGNFSEDWEIPFEAISELEWLGSGAQGAVFRGKYKNECVAVKKVRDIKETDIKHLRKLDHQNIIKFKGVCSQSPVYCIVMEYCPNGPLQNIIKSESSLLPARLLSWAKQIARGMQYLHQHKIIHRDLKSPNILIGQNQVVKISDFGTSREWNEVSTKMSFAGTVAWMAPEVIRNEPCSEKVDVWSFGVVLWEMLTCEIPYKDVDSSAIIWGVGNNSLQLHIPSSCPEGFKLLVQLCWNTKPRNRPSFRQILSHIEIAGSELLKDCDIDFIKKQSCWKEEIRNHMKKITQNGTNIHKYEEDLIKRRTAEWQHAQDIRRVYEDRLEKTNKLFLELSECLTQLQEKRKEITELEKKLCSYKPSRRIGNTFRKFQYYRGKMSNSSSLNSCDQSTTPSPNTTPESPVKATLYSHFTDLEQPRSVAVTSQTKYRKSRYHRKNLGCYALITKMNRNRTEQCLNDIILPDKPQLMNSETQTNILDLTHSENLNMVCDQTNNGLSPDDILTMNAEKKLPGISSEQKEDKYEEETTCFRPQHLNLLKKQSQSLDIEHILLQSPNGNSNICKTFPMQLENAHKKWTKHSRKPETVPNINDINQNNDITSDTNSSDDKANTIDDDNIFDQCDCENFYQNNVNNNNEKLHSDAKSCNLNENLHSSEQGHNDNYAKQNCTDLNRCSFSKIKLPLYKNLHTCTDRSSPINKMSTVSSSNNLTQDDWTDDEEFNKNFLIRRKSGTRLPIRGKYRRCYKQKIKQVIPVEKSDDDSISDSYSEDICNLQNKSHFIGIKDSSMRLDT
ncbi:mitogen-activated protein kinase kinase kinase 13 [Condylostylus longicornis]|uniref:mitogen-activated protein kinase kinase kinase 13 n=1 Tax=Condylostylus longicornis TaxID=2530218 RepID=UPI00244E0C57|nr:mitogen-activated protein kinase kinase kinase 13 [Condylostylus longicornis]